MTNPAYQDDQITVYLGDCLDILPTLADNSIDAVVTDPPYEISFMSRHWDASGIAYNIDVWRQCLRVLKPGGHLLAFGGTRTWHRLAVAIEDAGFEMRDSIAWLYGSGFPKSLDVSKAIDKAAGAEREVIGSDPQRNGKGTFRLHGFSTVAELEHAAACGAKCPDGRDASATLARLNDETGADITAPATDNAKQWAGFGTALKPAHEPIILARKPLQGTVAANVLAHGTGALNIDASRIESGPRPAITNIRDGRTNFVDFGKGSRSDGVTSTGRWPANVILDEQAAAELDQQSGTLTSGANPTRRGSDKFRNTYGDNTYGDFTGQTECAAHRGIDSGGASRFFYTPKAPTNQRPTVDDTTHPTVKPVDLMCWLIRLVTPPHGLVLDCFAGTGSTAEAALLEHKSCILIEREPDYLRLITARLSKPIQIGFDWNTT